MAGRAILATDHESRLYFDGAPVTEGDRESVLASLAELAESDSARLLVTLNVDLTLQAEEDEEFRRILRGADARVLDGAPLVAVARAIGANRAQRITGADLLPLLAEQSAANGKRIVVLGGAPGIADSAAANLRAEHRGVEIETVDFPFVDDVSDTSLDAVVAELRGHAPDYVFVCLGAPKQEKWFDAWRDELPAALYIGAGAAIDFQAGAKSRAPRLVQRIGLEWFWRLAQEPTRLAERYLFKGPKFLLAAMRSIRLGKGSVGTSAVASGRGLESTVFISWFPFHGRSDGIARELGIRGYFFDGGDGNRIVRYWRQWRQTKRLLSSEAPSTILLMMPPVVALWSALRFAKRTGARIAGDLHTGAFDDPKWTWATKHTLRLLRRHGIAIVTNEALADVAKAVGCPSIVMHDRIEIWERDVSPYDDPRLEHIGSPSVLVPLAYAHDEPIDELLEAAREMSDVQWVFTGDAPASIQRAAGPNVVFSGFVANEDFLRLASRTDITMAVTKNESTMQRAGYESLNLGKTLVTSDTRVLRDYYQGAAHIAEPTCASLVASVRAALADELAEGNMLRLRSQRMEDQEAAMKKLRDWVMRG